MMLLNLQEIKENHRNVNYVMKAAGCIYFMYTIAMQQMKK